MSQRPRTSQPPPSQHTIIPDRHTPFQSSGLRLFACAVGVVGFAEAQRRSVADFNMLVWIRVRREVAELSICGRFRTRIRARARTGSSTRALSSANVHLVSVSFMAANGVT
eukprot:152883-Rhodomonas_salina.4